MKSQAIGQQSVTGPRSGAGQQSARGADPQEGESPAELLQERLEILEAEYLLLKSEVKLLRDRLTALLGPADPLAPMRGKYQLHQRKSLTQQNPTDGPEVQAAAIAKHLGLEPHEGKGVEPTPRGTATGVSPSQ